MKKWRIAGLTIMLVLILGGFVWGKPALGNGNHTKEFPSDFDRLNTLLQQPINLFSHSAHRTISHRMPWR